MSGIKTFLQKNPALAAAFLPVIGIVLGMFVDDAALVAALVGVFAALLGVHHVVTPVTTMVEKVTTATTNTAMKVAEDLTEATVGTVGELTKPATEIVEHVIDLTLTDVLNGKEIDLSHELRNGKEDH